jgi:hypothetical protein
MLIGDKLISITQPSVRCTALAVFQAKALRNGRFSTATTF